jgi:hypothetical protein
MIYVIATLIYLMMALLSRALVINMQRNQHEKDIATGCFSTVCILCIVAIEIWFIGLGLTHLGIIL